MPVEYIDYMMGHKLSTYHDIQMKGVEFLRNIYAVSGFCIRPKPKAEVYDLIEELLRAREYLVDRDMLMRAVSVPHRTVVSRDGFEEDRRRMLRDAFLEMLRMELNQASSEDPWRGYGRD